MEKQLKIQTGKSLAAAVDAIVKESLKTSLYQNGLEEKERQRHMLGEKDNDLFDDAASGQGAEAKPKSSKTIDSEKEKLKGGDVTAEDVIEKLNSIRAGKSFKDEEIEARLSEYVESLSKPEKVALLAFLKGISQIVTGEIEAEKALDPSEKPANVEMKKVSTVQKKTLKPNVIKAPSKEKTEKKPEAEDTSGPVPIVPKKK